jgi:S-adenosylmethionine:tRNA ribosyltransferase-isomerase
MKQYGELPLPPYIEYTKSKEEDYQTTFAKKEGSVAAPTASLHFTQELLAKLPIEEKYITLHVGLGTFKGIDTDDVRDYKIHGELIEVDISLFSEIYNLKTSKKKILAIGTTVCRTLESLPHLWNHLTQIQKNIFPE